MPTPDSVLQHRAAELVLHYHKSLGQSARILGTNVPTVQKLVNQFLDEHPQAVPSTASSDNAIAELQRLTRIIEKFFNKSSEKLLKEDSQADDQSNQTDGVVCSCSDIDEIRCRV
jgi:hypothetical protein